MAERPIVAELGRPETPEETAARKAASSRAYRSSQSFRNLIVALAVTLGVVLVVVWAVPRGEPAEQRTIDVRAIADDVTAAYERPVVVPDVPEGWRVNAANVETARTVSWNVVYAPAGGGFLTLAQGFDAGEEFASGLLGGTSPDGTVRVAGVEWDRYEIADPDRNRNISFALATQSGEDHIVLYGDRDQEETEQFAQLVAPQLQGGQNG